MNRKKILMTLSGLLALGLIFPGKVQAQTTPPGEKCGIGTDNPISRLEVKGLGNTYNSSSFHVMDSDEQSMLYVRDDKRVGIGTSNPTELLDVNGTVKATDFIGDGSQLTGTSPWSEDGTSTLTFDGNVGIGTTYTPSTLTINATGSTNPLRVRYQNITSLCVFNNKGVTIGAYKIPPSSGLHVVGRTGIGTTYTPAQLTVDASASTTPFRVNSGGTFALSVYTNKGTSIGASVLPPDNGLHVSGFVGIGTTDAAAQLTVAGPTDKGALHVESGGSPALYVNNNQGVTIGESMAGPSQGLYVKGDVAIGTSSSYGYKFYVYGDAKISGNLTAYNFPTASDRRFKKDIDILENSLEAVNKLEGVAYYWDTGRHPERGFNTKKQIGFIAQEVEKILPELVMTDAQGYKAVEYAKLTPVLVEAIKELNRMNQQQEVTIEQLREQVATMASMESRIEALEALLEKQSETTRAAVK